MTKDEIVKELRTVGCLDLSEITMEAAASLITALEKENAELLKIAEAADKLMNTPMNGYAYCAETETLINALRAHKAS